MLTDQEFETMCRDWQQVCLGDMQEVMLNDDETWCVFPITKETRDAHFDSAGLTPEERDGVMCHPLPDGNFLIPIRVASLARLRRAFPDAASPGEAMAEIARRLN